MRGGGLSRWRWGRWRWWVPILLSYRPIFKQFLKVCVQITFKFPSNLGFWYHKIADIVIIPSGNTCNVNGGIRIPIHAAAALDNGWSYWLADWTNPDTTMHLTTLRSNTMPKMSGNRRNRQRSSFLYRTSDGGKSYCSNLQCNVLCLQETHRCVRRYIQSLEVSIVILASKLTQP